MTSVVAKASTCRAADISAVKVFVVKFIYASERDQSQTFQRWEGCMLTLKNNLQGASELAVVQLTTANVTNIVHHLFEQNCADRIAVRKQDLYAEHLSQA